MARSEADRIEIVERTKLLYHRLMALPRPEGLSNNAWAQKAGVNSSFFTNLQNGREPGVFRLESVLEAIGWTMERFFAGDPPTD